MSSVVRSEETIFLEALEKRSPEDLEAFLRSACGDDTAMLSSVRDLLQAYPRGEFLESAAEVRLDVEGESAVVDGVEAGTRIGLYVIRRLIAEGGMGLVYEAEQTQPIRRGVALKLIKPGMDSREIIARFEAERQALAMMDHPHIARVLDAGTTDSGRPYFVMELVDGERITRFCDQQQYSFQQRLDLFLDVCDAVRHAHQRGIIHRDIKPSNVLVSLHDGRPVVKVIDFGIAKALTAQSDQQTMMTSAGYLLGTPMYMSPEQAEFGGMSVDTRTDVYSLGVLLYQLLTGTTPFDQAQFREASFDEIRRLVREVEPLRPSIQVSTLNNSQLQTIAEQQHAEQDRLQHQLRGDPDWIIMKAIEKDRDRRYDSVSALSADIRRYLNHEPIEARPPSGLYRLRKYYRRHRTLLVSAAVVIAALLSGTTIAVLQAHRAIEAERTARIERSRALASEHNMQQMLYAADIQLADEAFRQNDAVRARESLNRHLPRPDQPDLRSFEWYFLSAKVGIPSMPLLASDGPLYFACPIGEDQVACCGADSLIRCLDTNSGRLLWKIDTGQTEVNGLAVSPDGKLLASAGDDGTVRFWDLATRESAGAIQAHQGKAFQAAFSPEGTAVVSCGDEPDARMWSLDDGQLLQTFSTEGHDLEVLCITADDLVALGCREGFLYVYERSTGKLISSTVAPKHPSRVNAVTCVGSSPDGYYLAEGHLLGTLNLRLANSPQHIWKRFVLKDSVQSLAFSADGQWLAAGDRSGAIVLIPLEDNNLQTADAGQSVVQPLRKESSWNAHEGRIYGLTFTADNQHLISTGHDGNAVLWSPFEDLNSQALTDWEANELAFGKVGEVVVASDRLRLYPRGATSDELSRQLMDPDWSGTYQRVTVASQSGQIAYVRNKENCVRISGFDLQSGRIEFQAQGKDQVSMIACSPDNRFLAVEIIPADISQIPDNTEDRTRYVLLYDCLNRHEVWRIPCDTLLDLVFSPDGQMVAFSVSRDSLCVNTESGKVVHHLSSTDGTTRGLCFSPDSRTLATVGGRMLRIWDMHSGEQRWSVVAHAIAIQDVAFCPNGRTVMTIGEDGLLRCWRWGVQRLALELPLPVGPVRELELSPDGRIALIRYYGGKVLMLDTSSSRPQ